MSLRGPATQHLHNEARRAEFDGTGGRVDGSDGISKVSFNFLHTLYIYR